MLKKGLLVLACAGLCAMGVEAQQRERYSDREDVRGFINDLSVEHQFNRAELMALFRDAKRQDAVIKAYEKPAERALTWAKYRRIFVKPDRIEGGVEFWKDNLEALERAEKEFGVPIEIIVAIIGVESKYGRFKGRNPVFDSLVTLSFDREKRKEFFRRELESYLLLCRDQGFNPTELKGSYAGAMGMPQFISSSYRSYAVDFDGDEVVDLFNNKVDVIGSVANYFKRHGWVPGASVVSRAEVEGEVTEEAVGRGRKGMKPEKTLAYFQSKGLVTSSDIPADDKVSLLHFEGKHGDEYWVGQKNFYVITRYNHSTMYALAVYQLSQEIKKAYLNG